MYNIIPAALRGTKQKREQVGPGTFVACLHQAGFHFHFLGKAEKGLVKKLSVITCQCTGGT